VRATDGRAASGGSVEGAWSVVLVGGVPVAGSRALGDWQLARALSRTHDVLYVDPPLYTRDRLYGSGTLRVRSEVEQLSPGLRVVRPIAAPGANRPWGSWLSDRLIGRQVREACAGASCRRVLLVFSAKRGSLEAVERDLLVYWRRDRVADLAFSARRHFAAERDLQLMQRADLVTGVSQPLVDEATAAGADAELVPNGCDFEHFARRQPLPVEFPKRRPVIGFAGGVGWRLDVDLLAGLADARPDWTILLVGEQAVEMPHRPNLVCVGARPYDRLPGWIQGFDVGIVPYRQDGFNLASSPLKIYEYLAAGVPVVSTSLPAVVPAAGLVWTAGSRDSFLAAVEASLAAPPGVLACRALAKANDWDARARRLSELVDARLQG
jgi:teichuronic acid biosynthesis glycosyltransferase TuaH